MGPGSDSLFGVWVFLFRGSRRAPSSIVRDGLFFLPRGNIRGGLPFFFLKKKKKN